MDKKKIEAYTYYKDMYPGAIILFHIGTDFVALADDAQKVAQSQVDVLLDNAGEARISEDDLETISALGDTFQVRMVSYRNDAGMLDYPDVDRLKQEKYADYWKFFDLI